MDEKQAAALRKEFPPEMIEKLPKGGQKLDFVGHAATTDRLLQVDPEWTWRPMGITQNGLPALDEHGGLWILLTICGVSKPGYGDAGTKTGPNAVKEAIGDAIRNAAMRFGVALDLWAKSDLHAADSEPQPKPERKPKPSAKPDHPVSRTEVADLDTDGNLMATDAQRKMLFAVGKKEQGLDDTQIRDVIEKLCGTRSTAEIPRNMVDAVVQELRLVGGAVPK